jgi:hypothetical protein
MGLEDDPQTCEECGGADLVTANDSILKRRYEFVSQGTLKLCQGCGAKYLVCKGCGGLLTRVHLSLDVYGVRDECAKCGMKNQSITDWIARGGG